MNNITVNEWTRRRSQGNEKLPVDDESGQSIDLIAQGVQRGDSANEVNSMCSPITIDRMNESAGGAQQTGAIKKIGTEQSSEGAQWIERVNQVEPFSNQENISHRTSDAPNNNSSAQVNLDDGQVRGVVAKAFIRTARDNVKESSTTLMGQTTHTSSSDVVQVTGYSDQKLDNEIARLRKMCQVMELKNSIYQLESGSSSVEPSPGYDKGYQRISFDEVKNMIEPFEGKSTYPVEQWLSDFEKIMDGMLANDRVKLSMARRLMVDAPRTWITMHSYSEAEWPKFKADLKEEFKTNVDTMTVFKELHRSKWQRSGTVRLNKYVLDMEAMAKRGGVREQELMIAILSGIDDKSSDVSVLTGACDLRQLKEKVPVYEALVNASNDNRRVAAPSVSSGYQGGNRVPVPAVASRYRGGNLRNANNRNLRQAVGNQRYQTSDRVIQCYNCSELSHRATQCTKVKRASKCFYCHELGHQIAQCPTKLGFQVNRAQCHQNRAQSVWKGNQLPETVAMVNAVQAEEQARSFAWSERNKNQTPEGDHEGLAAIQEVSVSIITTKDCHTSFKSVIALLDTGSPVSFIRKSEIPNECLLMPRHASRFKALGNQMIYSYGSVKSMINIKNRVCCISLLVIDDQVLPLPILLGRDGLKRFEIRLKFHQSSVPRHVLQSILKTNDNVNTPIRQSNGKPVKLIKLEQQIESRKVKSQQKSSVSIFHFEPKPVEVNRIHEIENNKVAESSLKGIEQESSDGSEWDLNIWYVQEEENEKNLVQIGAGFGEDNRLKCKQMFDEYFKRGPPNVLHTMHPMHIRLTSDAPFHYAPRRLSFHDKQEVGKMVKQLMDEGIVQPSDSPYASPIVLVSKKDGSMRMCVDYRTLNKLTVRDNFPLPLIEDCIQYLEGKTCFSLIDLRSGFHQVHMAKDSVKYTSFVTPRGQYEYLRMPFGLKNGPSVFQRFITRALRDMVEKEEIMVYMDDIILATSDVSTHLDLLNKLLGLLSEYGLEIKPSKCKILQHEIQYLGYLANSQGIRPSDEHVRTIRNYPQPTNLKQLQSALGLFSYFRRFVPFFSRVAGPLLNLVRKDTHFNFDKECERAFRALRDLLVQAPVLAIFNMEKETELHTDASSSGYGAVLMQRQDDKSFHPVSYFSRRTTPAESRYHSFELETMAIVYAIRRFEQYLKGIPFRIVTDCHALTMTLARKDINPKIARWALELESYNYEIIHRKGESMGHVDALSRNLPVAAITEEETEMHIQAIQSRDSDIVKIRGQLEQGVVRNFDLKQGLVYRIMGEDREAIYVPRELEGNIIQLVHEKIGHLGENKCYNSIRTHYWFPNMKEKIKTFIVNCIRCIMHSKPNRVNERELHSIQRIPVPFDTLHIDHYGPLPSVRSKRKYILVVTDGFTKHVKLYAVNTTSTKEVCASLKKYFEYFGRPRRIVSDRGTCFTSLEFAKFMRDNNIVHVKVATASPQANGQVERVNRVLTPVLGKISEIQGQTDWSLVLHRVEYALNNTSSATTKQTPSVLLFGVNQRGPQVDLLTEYVEEIQAKKRVNLVNVRKDALEEIEKTQRSNESYYAKRSVNPKKFEEGEFVVIKNVDTTIGTNKKLVPKYKGPYKIVKILPNDRYIVGDIDTCQLAQIPYKGTLEAARLKKWTTAKEEIVATCFGS